MLRWTFRILLLVSIIFVGFVVFHPELSEEASGVAQAGLNLWGDIVDLSEALWSVLTESAEVVVELWDEYVANGWFA